MRALFILNIILVIIKLSKCDDCLFVGCDCSTPGQVICKGNSQNQAPQRSATYSNIKIDKIQISNYMINSLPVPTIFNNLIIGELYLSNNNINKLSNGSFDVTSINSLYISEPALNTIETGFFLPLRNSLTKFSLIDCKLNDTVFNSFEASFQQIGLLQELSLSGNSLNNMRPSIINSFKNLVNLDLSRNSLTSNSSIFDSNSNLQSVVLDSNSITSLDGLIKRLSSSNNTLQMLSIKSNQITNLASFSTLGSLSILALSFNQIKSISSAFSGLNNLKYLYLDSNQIESIDQNWFTIPMTQLLSVDLSNNRLSSIPNLKLLNFMQTLNMANQNGALKTIGAYSFERQAYQFMTVALDKNDNISFDQNAFCTASTNDYSLKGLILSYSSAVNFNKCFFKSIKANVNYFLGANTANVFEIRDFSGVSNLGQVCNCNFLKFANAYGFSVSGACDSFIAGQNQTCTGIGVDDCPGLFNCGIVPTTTAPAISSTTLTSSNQNATKNSSSNISYNNILNILVSVFTFVLVFF